MLSRAVWLALALAAVIGVSAVVGGLLPPPGTGAPLPGGRAASTPSGPGGTTSLVQPDSSSTAAPAGEEALLARATEAGANPYNIFLPRALAAPADSGGGSALAHVRPPYSSSPAPMGIADYGLRNATNGSVVPYRLNTTRLVGTVDEWGPGIVPFYLDSGAPDSYAIQLDAVITNVTLFGQPGYQFWIQDVLEYSVGRDQLTLISNVWNFSALGAVDSPNLLAAHGPNGRLVPYDVYYSNLTIPNVEGPFDASLFLNSSVNASRDQVNFSAVVSGPSGTIAEPFDYVVFNSTVNTTARFSNPASFTIDGFETNPAGYTDDFELDVGGPGDGLQTNLYQADANLSLVFWNATAKVYRNVPSAESYGGDSGETASGASLAWLEEAHGPFDANIYAVMTSGPGFLHGLWNASTPRGATPVSFSLDPSNAWVFVRSNATVPESNFSVVESEWAPTELNNGSFVLGPGNYTVDVLESEYTPETLFLDVGGSALAVPVSLDPNASAGIYAPLYAWNDAQLAALASSGSGTAASPYVLPNVQPAPFAPEFGTLNDYTYPVYAGVLFTNTNATVELLDPPAFATETPFPPPDTCPITLACLPDTNALQYQLYNTSHVAIVDATNISGWFATGVGTFSALYPTLALDTVVVWNSTHDLIAGNQFDLAAAGGIYLYGGSGNTIWGNIFRQGAPPEAGSGALWPSFYGVAVQEMESHDLIYNDLFDNSKAGTTAWTPILNPYTQTYKTWTDTWNVSSAPADSVRYATGFPTIPLSGSVVRTSTQGGSYWWDYGTNANPLRSLPYNASGHIVVAGDYHPLVPELSANFTETGLPTGTNWSVTLNGMTESSTGPSIEFSYQDVLDTATFVVGSVAGYVAIPSSGNLTLNLTYTTNVTVRFAPDVGNLSGTVSPSDALLAVDGTSVSLGSNGSFDLALAAGIHPIVATASGYYPYYANVSVAFNRTTELAISLNPIHPIGPNGTLELTVTPGNASISVNGVSISLTSGSYSAPEPPGVYAIEGTAPGYYEYFNNVTVASSATTTLQILLNPISPIGPNGTIELSVSPASAAVSVDGKAVSLSSGHASLSAAIGFHSIEATATGYYPYFNNVSVTSGGTTTVTIALNPVTPVPGPNGNLSVAIGTVGATLWIDGSPVTLTNGAYFGTATPGVHSIEIQANGYFPYYNNVTVVSGRTTSLAVTLDPYAAPTSSTTGIGETGWVLIAGLAAVAMIFFLTTILLARRQAGTAPNPPASPPPPPPAAPPPGEPPAGSS